MPDPDTGREAPDAASAGPATGDETTPRGSTTGGSQADGSTADAAAPLGQKGSGAVGQRLAVLVHGGADVLGTTARLLAAPFDLLLRLFVAGPFFVSGLLKLNDWQLALLLARNEYPVDWLAAESAAVLGVSIELLGAVALAFGLATRVGAAALLGLTVVVHLEYAALGQNLLIAALCAWFVVMGAGALSLDRAAGRGLADTAVPLAAALTRICAWITTTLGPLAIVALRGWLGLLTLLWGLALLGGTDLALAARTGWHLPVLEVPTDAVGLGLVVIALAVCVLVGFATRAAALVLALLTALSGGMGFGPHTESTAVALSLVLLFMQPAGSMSMDALVVAATRRAFPRFEDLPPSARATLPRVVIVGAGFGGLACAAALRHRHCRVTLIDRHNYHLFQPLLYQVATATLSPAEIATPVRTMTRDLENVGVVLGTVTGIDRATREVQIGERRIGYDHLVLATGARHSYFGRDEWSAFAPGLKQVDDATDVRRRILLAFERAENSDDETERAALLTFVIVGAGPTGVELAGAIAELAHHGMANDFSRIDPADARVILVQSGPRVLPAFPASLSARTERDLVRLGVEVRTGGRVLDMDADGVLVGEQRIAARTVFWAAGVAASPAAGWLAVEADRAGRIKVAADCGVPDRPDVYALGDTAYLEAWNGGPVPGLAPAAKQAGTFVASVITARLEGRRPPTAFVYHHRGSMATIGRKAAVADFGRLRLSGAPAWWLWGVVHVAFLANMRSRVSVALNWFWAYLTFRASTRLITGTDTG